ncbi:reductive dehalogenase [Dehalobacter sp. MCB1]|nr:reductive dehalogenase [Dehalobacter sp. MCB1]TCX54870.1 reductive dehalogenase [Dehalobacter sp. 12DCB1]
MNMDSKENDFRDIKLKLSRRNFLKSSIGIGLGASVLSYDMLVNPENSLAAGLSITEHDTMPVEISADYQRMEQKNTVIIRGRTGDPKIKPYFDSYLGKRDGLIPQKGGDGWSEIDAALDIAAWSVENDFNKGSAAGIAGNGLYSWEGKVNPNMVTFESPEAASKTIKKAAAFLGASLVGIAPYDERWVYSTVVNMKTRESVPNNLPFKPKSVIVMALEMNYEAFQTAPALIGAAAAGNIYSNMSATAHKVATFVRRLGYQAIPCGNDTALSVPLAIHAGLGELSRIGILVTPKFGPRVRLCKVFTDMPLAVDKPITFGVKEFCTTCMKCADACPSEAISKEKEPSFQLGSVSTNPGVKKWAADGEKCASFWGENGGDCGICIKVCPYNKLDEWQHDLAKLGTRTPARPILRFFDDLFGYGKANVVDETKKFWNK